MDTEDYAITFEAKLVGSTFSEARGHKVTFIIHPHDILESRSNSPKKAADNARVRNMATKLGTRYQCVLVQMEDESDEPVISEDARQGDSAVMTAGMLCRNPKFQIWICPDEEPTEDKAVARLRSLCGVESRSELKENERAREILEDLRAQFLDIEGGR